MRSGKGECPYEEWEGGTPLYMMFKRGQSLGKSAGKSLYKG